MSASFIFGGDTGETPQSLEAKRNIAQALAYRAMSDSPKNLGEGLTAVGRALAYRAAMNDFMGAESSAQKDYAGSLSSILGGGMSPASPAVPSTPTQPQQPQIPAAAVSGGDLTNTPQSLSGGTLPVQTADASQPRGFRNNNPLNIEAGNFTQSQPGFTGSDGRFAQFGSMDQGLGAADRLLQSYAGKGINTISGIVNRWAPPSDNNPTSAYAATVAKAVGVDPNAPLNMADPAVRQKVIGAMAQFENGKPLPPIASNDPNFMPQPSSFSNPQLAAMLSPSMTVGQQAFQPPQAPSGPVMAFNGQPPSANQLANPQAFAQPPQGGPQPVGQGTFAPPSGAQPNVTNLATRPAQLPIEGQNPGRAAVVQALQGQGQPQPQPQPTSNIPPQVAETIRRLSMNPLPQAQQMASQLMQQYMKPHQYGFQTLPDGTVVRTDPLSGTITPVYQANKPHFVPNASHDQYGNPIGGFVNDVTGEIKLIGTNGQPMPQGGAPVQTGDLHGQDFLKTLDPGKAETVKGIAEGRIPYPSGFIMKTPYGQWLTQAVGQYEPGIDATQINQRHKMRTDLGASSPNSMGGILSNGKSAFDHLAELSDRYANLGNYNGPDIPGAGVAATAGNFIGNELLPTASTKDKLKQAQDNALKYGQEATKFYAGTGGGEAERMNALHSVNPATATSAEMAGYLETEKSLMLDRLRQKEAQIKDTLGEGYLQQHPVMTPDLQQRINKIDANISKLRGGSAPATVAPPKPGNYKFNQATGQLEPQ